MLQIGLGILSQEDRFGDRPLSGIVRGAFQGATNATQIANQNELMAERKANAAEKQRVIQARMALAERIKKMAPQPRPLAFPRQEGDEQTLQNYNDQHAMADAIVAGMSPAEYFNVQTRKAENEAARIERGEQAAANRQAQAEALKERFAQQLELAKMHGADMKELRQMQLQQSLALREMANSNARPVEVYDPVTGAVTLVKPSDSYGKQAPPRSVNLTNEQKRQQSLAALDFADQELAKLDAQIEKNPRSIGPVGYVQRFYETGKGMVTPEAKTPAIDTRNVQMNTLATIRKRITDANASNRDIEHALETMGGSLLSTAGSARTSIVDLRKQLKMQREALAGANAAKAPTPTEETKTIDGKTYVKRNGQWFSQ